MTLIRRLAFNITEKSAPVKRLNLFPIKCDYNVIECRKQETPLILYVMIIGSNNQRIHDSCCSNKLRRIFKHFL